MSEDIMTIFNKDKSYGDDGYYRVNPRHNGVVEVVETVVVDGDDVTVTIKQGSNTHIFRYNLGTLKKSKQQSIKECSNKSRRLMTNMLYCDRYAKATQDLLEHLAVWYAEPDEKMMLNRKYNPVKETTRLRLNYDDALGKIKTLIKIKE